MPNKFNLKQIKIAFVLIILLLLIITVIVVSVQNANKKTTSNQQVDQNINLDENQEQIDQKTPVEPPNNPTESQIFTSSKGQKLEILQPKIDQEIACPLEISGKIAGNWFFEASFPIEIMQNGEKIDTIVATAKEEWMTTNPVLFSANYDCQNCQEGSLDLVFKKDNPSGLPENDDEIKVKLNNFKCNKTPTNTTSDDSVEINVFFAKEESGQDCQKVFAVKRSIKPTLAIGRASILELLKGVNQQELNQKYQSEIPNKVKLNSIKIENEEAFVDFSKELNSAAGSCRVQIIEAQITETLKQFPTIKRVTITADGQITLQP